MVEVDTRHSKELVQKILKAIGENEKRDGLIDTPERVVKSWSELFSGYKEDPRCHLEKRFEVAHDQLISLNNITFHSTCEHHMLPFYGTADVAYLPSKEGGWVVGLSKLARTVNGYARRLQVQERLTDQIADAVHEVLNARAVAVRVRAKHFCMVARGVKNETGTMTTTAVRGLLKTDHTMRAEWISGLPQ